MTKDAIKTDNEYVMTKEQFIDLQTLLARLWNLSKRHRKAIDTVLNYVDDQIYN